MKLSLGKKVLLFFHWLLSLAACALAVLYCVIPDTVGVCFNKAYEAIGKLQTDIIGGVILAAYVVLAIITLAIIFSGRRRADRAFIMVDSSETGKTRIAVGAVEQMIRQAVHSVDGITELKSKIENFEDSIVINVDMSIQSGSHVPTVTMNIQRAIRSYIELNCGVAVREVCVSVHAVETPGESDRRGRHRSAKAALKENPVAPMTPPAEPAAQPVETPTVSEIPEAPLAEESAEFVAEAEPVLTPEMPELSENSEDNE